MIIALARASDDMALDLEPHLPAFAQDVAEVLQRLGQVAAGLLLDREADDEELELGRIEPLGRFPERLVDRLPELDCIGNAAELDADRISELGAHRLDRLGHRQARFQTANDEVDGFGKEGDEFFQAPGD